jgi:hypothetical protein
MEIGMPSSAVRKMYFQKKLKVSDDEIERWVTASNGFSFAACAELVISVCCFENKFENAVEILKEMSTINISSRDYNVTGAPVGFSQTQKR